MSDPEAFDKRSQFLRRISTVGGGVRETLQMGMGGIVTDIRAFIERGMFDDEDLDDIVAFHDAAELFWRSIISSNPPLEPAMIVQRLSALESSAPGALEGFRIRIGDLRSKAETFERTRRLAKSEND